MRLFDDIRKGSWVRKDRRTINPVHDKHNILKNRNLSPNLVF